MFWGPFEGDCQAGILRWALEIFLFDFENLRPRFLTIFSGPRFSKSNKKNSKAYLGILARRSLLNGP